MTEQKKSVTTTVQNVSSPTAKWSDGWLKNGYNYCLESASKALRFLADHPRPSGGEQTYNAMHLLQMAEELEVTHKALQGGHLHRPASVAAQALPAAAVPSKPAAQPSPASLNLDVMSLTFEESQFYFNGESPVRRMEDWQVWRTAWKAALAQRASLVTPAHVRVIATDIRDGFGDLLTTDQIVAIYDSFVGAIKKYEAAVQPASELPAALLPAANVAKPAELLKQAEIGGTVRFLRSDKEGQVCVCCPTGTGHIFGRHIEWDSFDTCRPAHFGRTANVFVDSVVTDFNQFEGKRVRMTIEVLADAEEQKPVLKTPKAWFENNEGEKRNIADFVHSYLPDVVFRAELIDGNPFDVVVSVVDDTGLVSPAAIEKCAAEVHLQDLFEYPEARGKEVVLTFEGGEPDCGYTLEDVRAEVGKLLS